MHAFTDTEGRRWELRVNVTSVKRVKNLTGVNLYSLLDDSCKPLADLVDDVVTLADVAYILCFDQAENRGVTDEQFGSALGGDSINEVVDAFLEALADFFPNPRVRGQLKALLVKVREVREAWEKKMEANTAKIGELDAEAILTSMSKPSGDTPESLA